MTNESLTSIEEAAENIAFVRKAEKGTEVFTEVLADAVINISKKVKSSVISAISFGAVTTTLGLGAFLTKEDGPKIDFLNTSVSDILAVVAAGACFKTLIDLISIRDGFEFGDTLKTSKKVFQEKGMVALRDIEEILGEQRISAFRDLIDATRRRLEKLETPE